MPTATSTPHTSSTSGDAFAAGAVAQNGIANVQAAGVVTGGGTGSGTGDISVRNSTNARVTDSGAALAESGYSAAEPPLTTASDTPAGGRAVAGYASASSGNTNASGVVAQNAVTNMALVGVAVGPSAGDIHVETANNVSMRTEGGAEALSGAAYARTGPGAGATGSTVATTNSGASTVSTATVVAATAPADPVSATGLAVTNRVTQGGGVVVTPSGAQGTLNVSHVQSVEMYNAGYAVATSAATCPTCATPVPPATPVAPGTPVVPVTPVNPSALTVTSTPSGGTAVAASAATATRLATGGASSAASGAADAHGLTAQNSVTTDARVGVRVGGENTGVIKVIVETVTNIINLGFGQAHSGEAVAKTGGAGGGGAPNAMVSADTEATGAVVTNDVRMSSTTAVRVDGDNHNPINLLVEMAARLFNRGHAAASSGSASAGSNGSNGGPGSAAASTGNASAAGLIVQNVVDMWADVLVDIKGNNTAPITIRVRFITDIVNEGIARATTGAAQALSTGLAGVTGGTGGASATAGGEQSEGSGVTVAASGSANAAGVFSETGMANVQAAAASGPLSKNGQSGLNVGNVTNLSVTTNGIAVSKTGDTVAGPTPTATPTSVPGPSSNPGGPTGSTNGDGSSDGSDSPPTRALNTIASRRVSGSVASVDPWSRMPARERPVMPGPKLPPVKKAPVGTEWDVEPWPDLPGRVRPYMPEGFGPPRAETAPAVEEPTAVAIRPAAVAAQTGPAPRAALPAVPAPTATPDASPSESTTEVGSSLDDASPADSDPSPISTAFTGSGGGGMRWMELLRLFLIILAAALAIAATRLLFTRRRALEWAPAFRAARMRLATLVAVFFALSVLLAFAVPVGAQGTGTATQSLPDRVTLLQLKGLPAAGAATQPGAPDPIQFEAVVDYTLRSASRGKLLIFTFENGAETSTQDSERAVSVSAGAGRATVTATYAPRSEVTSLTLLIGLLDEKGTLTAWAATNPLDVGSWPARSAFTEAMAARLAGDYVSTVRHLNEAITLGPPHPHYFYWRADALSRLGRYEASLRDYTTALASAPEDRVFRIGYGAALLWLEDWETAAAEFSRIIAQGLPADGSLGSPQDRPQAWAYRGRGIARSALGEIDAAVADYRAYLALSPNVNDRAEVEQWIAALTSAM